MYGSPVVPSCPVYSDPASVSTASTPNFAGQVSNASCTEQDQFDSKLSSMPFSAGETASMCTLSVQPAPWTEKPLPPKSRPSSNDT